MDPVRIPSTDVNSERAVLTRWLRPDRSPVTTGEPLLDAETSKSVFEVACPQSGVLHHLVDEGEEVPISEPVGLVFPDLAALEEHIAGVRRPADRPAADDSAAFISDAARSRAAALGVDLAQLAVHGLVTLADVEATAQASGPRAPGAARGEPEPRRPRPGMQRLLVVGAGRGAQVVLDMLLESRTHEALALLDDDPSRRGTHVGGIPVVGGTDRLEDLVSGGSFDAAVLAIAGPVEVRARLRLICHRAGLPLANVVDRTARVAGDAVLGEGNIIGAFCHIGSGTRLGDGNRLSAYTSIDHHNVVGSEVSTGPGCATSGAVTIGDHVVLGTGVHIEPDVVLGDGVQVASGATVLTSVPAWHAVKTRTFTTTVVPLQRRP